MKKQVLAASSSLQLVSAPMVSSSAVASTVTTLALLLTRSIKIMQSSCAPTKQKLFIDSFDIFPVGLLAHGFLCLLQMPRPSTIILILCTVQ